VSPVEVTAWLAVRAMALSLPTPNRCLRRFGNSSQTFYRLLGVRIAAVQIPDAIAQIEEWIAQRDGCRYIAVSGMHGVTEAQHDAKFKQILNSAALVVPDGDPLVWLGRRRGFSEMRRRVYGPELMKTFCAQTANRGYRHFFYGGAPGVPEELANRLTTRYPGLIIAGTYRPPVPRAH
jgi:N-acetylglucosaminyldiphosphoundecaprenol N-acetyl-beta-D-mannosaminyltransferase